MQILQTTSITSTIWPYKKQSTTKKQSTAAKQYKWFQELCIDSLILAKPQCN